MHIVPFKAPQATSGRLNIAPHIRTIRKLRNLAVSDVLGLPFPASAVARPPDNLATFASSSLMHTCTGTSCLPPTP